MTAAGPARRLTEAEETRGAELYEGGAATREVARELSISRSSAQRLKGRLIEAGRLAAAAPADDPGETATAGHGEHQAGGGPGPWELTLLQPAARDRDAEIAALLEARDALGAALLIQEDRADASRQALAGLDAERLAMLESGRDAAVLRPRMRDAQSDLDDWETAAELLRSRLDEVGRGITLLSAERDLDAGQAALSAELAAGEQLAAAAPAVLRDAVQAIRAAAAGVVAYRVSVAAAQARIDGRHQAVSIALGALGRVPGPAPVLGQAAPLPDVPRDPGVDALARGWELAGTAAAGDGYGTNAAERLAPELAAAGDVYGRADAWEASADERLEQARATAAVRAHQAAEMAAVRERGLSGGAQPWGTDLDGNGNPTWRDPRVRLADRSDAYPGTPPEHAYGPW